MNDSQIKVSVLIPIHNTENYLRACLDSAINQSLKEIEIICVNDASTDSSAEILAEYQKKDSRIKTIEFPENIGTFLARKRAVETASGQYLMFLDSDDTYTLNACEVAFQQIEAHKVEIFHFSVNLFSKEMIPWKEFRAMRKFFLLHSGKLEGKEIFLASFGESNKKDHILCNKIFLASLCKRAYEQLPDLHLTGSEDRFSYFAISFMANSYYGSYINLYNYNLGIGISAGTFYKLSDKQFHDFCKTAQIVPLLEKFLQTQNADEKYYRTLDDINEELFTMALNKFFLMGSPQKWEDIFVQYWFHGDKRLLQNFISREKRRSLSLKLGLFLTWIPRKILSLLTGKEY